MPEWERLIDVYGPWLVPIGLFFYYQLWPTVKGPLVAWLRPERAEKRRRDIEEAEQARRNEERQREDRIFAAFENNTKALTGLQSTLGHVDDSIRGLNEDVAGLYGYLQKPRPSRSKEKTDAS